MARRSGFTAQVAQAQRAAERQRAAQTRANAQAQRAAERAKAAYLRAKVADEREGKRLYSESRAAEVMAMNEQLEQTLAEEVLTVALHIDDYLDLESLKQPVWVPQFDATTFGAAQPTPALEAFLPEPPSGVARLFGAAKHEKQAQEAQARFDAATTEHRRWSAERERTIAAARAQYDADAAARIADIRHRNGQVDELREQLVDGRPDAITTYLNLVLERSAYPDGFANEWRLAFVPDSAQLVVEYELPTLEVIPTVKVYKYVKSTDTISKTPRPVSQVRVPERELLSVRGGT